MVVNSPVFRDRSREVFASHLITATKIEKRAQNNSNFFAVPESIDSKGRIGYARPTVSEDHRLIHPFMLPANLPTGDPEHVSELLAEWNSGDKTALDKLVPIIYDELKRQARRHMRRERPDHTLETSAIVHEAYIKLAEQRNVIWENRAHFFWLASEIMRRVLVDHARGKNRQKRGAGAEMLTLEPGLAAAPGSSVDLLELDEALKHLEATDRQQAKVVELKFFAGLNVEEIAETLGISIATVKRDWAVAKAWLSRELGPRK